MDGRRAPYGRCRFTAAMWTLPRACQALSRPTRCVDRLVPVGPATHFRRAGQRGHSTRSMRMSTMVVWPVRGDDRASPVAPRAPRVVPISQRIPDRRHRSPARSRSPLLVSTAPSVLRSRRQGCAIGCETARHHASTGSFPAGSSGSPGHGRATAWPASSAASFIHSPGSEDVDGSIDFIFTVAPP